MSKYRDCSRTEASLSLVIGASAGLGRALSFELAKLGHRLILAARDEKDLWAVAVDCRERFNASVEIFVLDLNNSQSVDSFLDSCFSKNEFTTNLFIVAGANATEDMGFPPAEVLVTLHAVNFLQPARIVSEFLQHRQQLGLATVVIASSIAAAAPRSRNAAYSSAKVALESFCFSMKAELARIGENTTKIQIYRLGYIDSGLSFGRKLLFPIISPEKAARCVVKNLHSNFTYYYLPGYWWWIVFVLRCLPWSIYKRLSF